MKLKSHWLLLGILSLAILLRFVYLGVIPGGFTPDEASQGYSAYSLLLTGKDEWGERLPLTSMRAFGDYRAPLQTYLMIPSVAIFGLNEFAVRLPSAIFGLLAVFAVYLLANELFPDKYRKILGTKVSIGHLAALFLTLSPWHIQFSRTALEANFGSFLFPLGFYLLLRGIRGSRRLLLLSSFILGINLYSYLAGKLFVPMFLAVFVFLHRKDLAKMRVKYWLPPLLIFLVFAIPIYTNTIFGEGNVRGKDLIITNLTREDLAVIDQQQFFSPLGNTSPILTRVFSNKLTYVTKSFFDNYLSYLSPTFWFSEGGRETTYSVFPGHPLLPIWFLVLLPFAIYQLIRTKERRLPLLAAWVLLGIIPAAITKLGYRPNRVGSLLGFWEILAAWGAIEIFARQKLKPWMGLVAALVITASFIFYLNLYFFTSSVVYPSALSYGYRQLVQKISEHAQVDEPVIIDKGSESHIFVAFYTALDPAEFQNAAQTWWPKVKAQKLLFLDMLDPYSLGRYTFKTFDRCTDLPSKALVVIPSAKMKDGFKPHVVATVEYPDQTPAFYLIRYDLGKDPGGKGLECF